MSEQPVVGFDQWNPSAGQNTDVWQTPPACARLAFSPLINSSQLCSPVEMSLVLGIGQRLDFR